MEAGIAGKYLEDELNRLEKSETWLERIVLSSGRVAAFKRAQPAASEHHFVLYFPPCQGVPFENELEEMAQLTLRYARIYARLCFGDPECYTIKHNGRRTVSVEDTHFHVHCLASAADKEKLFRSLYPVRTRV